MLEDEINTPINDWDENFIKELERRSRSFADGTAKTYSWEETKAAARKRLKSKKEERHLFPTLPKFGYG